VCICGYYCIYHNDLFYKYLVNDMFVMFQQMVIANTAMTCVIKQHGQYVLLSVVLLVICVSEHRGWCSPKGEGYVTTLAKNSCKIYMTTC